MNPYKTYQMPKSKEGNSELFFKFEDGVSTKFRILDNEPVVFNTSYEDRISTKYAVVVWNRSAEKVQILQLPKTAFGMVQDIAADDDWGYPMEYDLTMKREGKGVDTRYTVTPTPKSDPVPEEAVNEAKELDLKQIMSKSEYNMNVLNLTEATTGATEAVDEGTIDLSDISFGE